MAGLCAWLYDFVPYDRRTQITTQHSFDCTTKLHHMRSTVPSRCYPAVAQCVLYTVIHFTISNIDISLHTAAHSYPLDRASFACCLSFANRSPTCAINWATSPGSMSSSLKRTC